MGEGIGMKQDIRMAAALLGLAASAALATAQTSCGCASCGGGSGGAGAALRNNESPSAADIIGHGYKGECYDRCWPQRYNNLAHRAVNRAFTPQVQNGHVLDQTMWNHMFEP